VQSPGVRIRAIADPHGGGTDGPGNVALIAPHYLVGDVVVANNPDDNLPGNNEFWRTTWKFTLLVATMISSAKSKIFEATASWY
jgi:hypothetical protein